MPQADPNSFPSVGASDYRRMRESVQSQLESTKKQMNDLAEKATIMQKVIESLDRLIDNLDENQVVSFGKFQKDFVAALSDSFEYTGKTLRDCLRIIFNRNIGKAVRVSDIHKDLLKGGYKTESPHLVSAIYVMISVLKRKGQIEKVAKGYYRANVEIK